jgi:uncharacterized short protein YbdD (DUF466 family)
MLDQFTKRAVNLIARFESPHSRRTRSRLRTDARDSELRRADRAADQLTTTCATPDVSSTIADCEVSHSSEPAANRDAPVSLGFAQAFDAFDLERAARGARSAALNLAWRLAYSVWRLVRQVSGDDAYERYVQHMARAHAGQPIMTRADYFKFCQEQKWNRITRCC